MRRRIAIAAVILAAAGAIALRAGAADSLIPQNGKPDAGTATPRAIDVRTVDRGNTRMVWLGVGIEQGSPLGQAATLAATDEIDVTAASLWVDAGGTTPFVGSASLATTLGLETTYPVQFAFTGHSSQHFTFDPPLRLRAGDRVFMDSNNAPAFCRVEISLHGYIPGAARENGIMAR